MNGITEPAASTTATAAVGAQNHEPVCMTQIRIVARFFLYDLQRIMIIIIINHARGTKVVTSSFSFKNVLSNSSFFATAVITSSDNVFYTMQQSMAGQNPTLVSSRPEADVF